MRHFPLYILFLLAAAAAHAQGSLADPTSLWWYPMGNPEGTRQNVTPTKSQTADDLVIRWRAPQLRNSPTLLVGALVLEEGGAAAARQQIVGVADNAIYILSADGTVRRKVVPDASWFKTPFTISLTGLFNSNAISPQPNKRPDLIGIGVERTQKNGGDSLWAFLLDTLGGVKRKVVIDPLPAREPSASQTAGIYPVAAYRSGSNAVVISAISQNLGSLQIDTVFNALRADAYGDASPFPNTGTQRWLYQVAPMIYPQHPAILVDPLQSSYQFALSTVPYAGRKLLITPDPSVPGARPTRTDSTYSVTLSDSAGRLVGAQTQPFPPAAETNTHFVALANELHTLITENYDGQHPGTPRISLVDDNVPGGSASYADPAVTDMGWRIVAADLDGRAPGRAANLPNYLYYPNNNGDEIVAARRQGNADVADNALYILRWKNAADTTAGGKQHFTVFMQQPFSGRLMASGDLLSDPDDRREVVIANGGTISILRLKDYSAPDFGGITNNSFFDTVKTVAFDSRVVAVAVADIDGDGDNELIVNTESATYAVGKRIAAPFRDLAADSALYCRGRQVKILWNRLPGGGQGGIRITLQSPGRPDSVIAYAHHPAKDIDPLNPGVGLDSIIIPTAGLRPGTYQILLQDTIVPEIHQTSEPFTVNQPVIHDVTIDTGSAARFGEPIRIRAAVDCAAGLIPLVSRDGVRWDTLRAVTVSGNITEARDTVPCNGECGDQQSVTLRYRFIDPNGYDTADAGTVRLSAPMRPLALAPGDTASRARRRTVSWAQGDFSCDKLRIALSADGGQSWKFIARDIPAGLLGYPIEIPDDVSGDLMLRVCCEEGTRASCEYGISPSFEVDRLPEGNYVAPNPFDPGDHSGTSNGAAIVYRLKEPGTVNITIFDASRAVVRGIVEGASQLSGERKREFWDGRNSRGDIVANGTYICVIESSSGERIVLPIIVLKRR